MFAIPLPNVRYAVSRRVGDRDEYLRSDGNFGPLSDFKVDEHRASENTRFFVEEEHAREFVETYERKYPTIAVFVPLEVRRIP
jgi:hypothetical protein